MHVFDRLVAALVIASLIITPLMMVAPKIMLPKAEAAFYSLDSIVSTLASIGGAGVVVLVVSASTGLAGGAALVTALSMLGGPFGIIGGICASALIACLVYHISQVGVNSILVSMIEHWKQQGKSENAIVREIRELPSLIVSDSTKAVAIEKVRLYF